MTFAVIDWLSISINLLLVVFFIVCLLMTLVILMQRPKQEGLGAAFGAGVTDQVFGARTTNVLQRGTVYLGSLFFILALTLAILISRKNSKPSMLETGTPAARVEEQAPATPKEEVKPKSLIEELPADQQTPADAPVATDSQPAPADTPDTAATSEADAPAGPTAESELAAPAGSPATAADEAPTAPEEKSGQP